MENMKGACSGSVTRSRKLGMTLNPLFFTDAPVYSFQRDGKDLPEQGSTCTLKSSRGEGGRPFIRDRMARVAMCLHDSDILSVPPF